MKTNFALPRRTPESQGVSSSAILRFIDGLHDADVEMHSIMLLRHGSVVADGWWKPYRPENRHVLFSVSKSFTSTAVGFAVAEGLISLDDLVVSFFPEDSPAEMSDNLARMRIADLLMMGAGHAEESLPSPLRGITNWAAGILAKPVQFKPGAYFAYNSGATYLVSSILRKVTGVSLTEYLLPRLFKPLGIMDCWWETCPMGTAAGAWGLNMRTEELARFGQLYLQKGLWNETMLLPEGWVELATSKHISNNDPAKIDWSQGYGYHFWRCRHNAYRGDGALGQFCVVMPDQDAVFVSTGGYQDMQIVLDLLWDHVLPEMSSGPVAESFDGHVALVNRMAALQLPTVDGSRDSETSRLVSGRTYRLEPNGDHWISLTPIFEGDRLTLEIVDADGPHTLTVDGPDWLDTTTDLTAGATPSPRDGRAGGVYPSAVSGAWTDPKTYTLKICGTESPFTSTFVLAFEPDGRVTIDRRANVAFEPTIRPRLVGSWVASSP